MELNPLPLVLLLISNIHSGQTEERPKVRVSVQPDGRVFRGETVNLTCVINGGGVTSWQYSWYKDDSVIQQSELQYYTISSVTESHTGKYTCRGTETSGSRSSHTSDAVTLTVSALPRATVTVTPDSSVFTGETVTLKCEIKDHYSDWRYQWYKGATAVSNSKHYRVNRDTLTIRGATQSDQNPFSCRGKRDGRPQTSQSNSSVSLTVTALPRATVSVTPDSSVFTGETVTLKCKIEDHYSGWRYQWNKSATAVSNSKHYSVNRDTLTIKGATQSDQNQFSCRGERDGRPQTSQSSSSVSVTVTERPKVRVSVQPDGRVFRGETVNLTCVINGGGVTSWQFSWYKDDSVIQQSELQYYTISSVTESHTGKYTCRGTETSGSRSSNTSDAVTLTVSALPRATVTVRPDSSVFTGETVTLKCEIKDHYSDWRYQWYKGSTAVSNSEHYSVNRDTLTIRGATQSDEDQFWCTAEIYRRPRTSQSSSSVSLTVTGGRSLSHRLIVGVTVGPIIMFLINVIFFLVLLRCYKNNKGKGSQAPSAVNQQQNISYTSEQKKSEYEYTPLQYGTEHIYDTLGAEDNEDTRTDNVNGAADLTNAEIELKPKKDLKKKKEEREAEEGRRSSQDELN